MKDKKSMSKAEERRRLLIWSLMVPVTFGFIIALGGVFQEYKFLNPFFAILAMLIVPCGFFIIFYYGVVRKVTYLSYWVQFGLIIGFGLFGNIVFNNILIAVVGAVSGAFIVELLKIGLNKRRNSGEIFAQRVGWIALILSIVSLLFIISLVV